MAEVETIPTISDELVAEFERNFLTRNTLLLQDGDLPVAEPVAEPERLPLDKLNDLYELGKCACVPHTPFVYIAYTQFAPQILEKWGIDDSCLRIVYASEDQGRKDGFEFLDHILFNPIVTPSSRNMQCVAEGCGSLDQLFMWIVRPYEVNISAYVWKPGMEKPQYRSCQISGCGAASLDHEQAHLDGLTAASYPFCERIIDFRRYPNLESLKRVYPSLTAHGHRDFANLPKEYLVNWLVWNCDHQRLEIVNGNGEFQYPYVQAREL